MDEGTTIPASLINARAETVATKASFRQAFHKRRCLVLADGFYEWQKPIYLRMREGEPFAFGGVWEQWRDCDRLVESFCIVTTAPNELCATVHDRMALILREEDYEAWLDADTSVEHVASLMRAHAAAAMECYPVSELVNNVRNEVAGCVERVEVEKVKRPAQMMLF